ncbi:MAG: hypothetical protein GXX78_16700 [Bacteroidales bacterium]|nr:hypothetical protein [Bacteroidales bacterium]
MELKTLIIILFTMLLFSCCSDAPCELTDDDMEWLLEEYDSLYYLKNGTDTVVIPVETTFGQDEYDWEYGIRTGDNDYYGYSKIKFRVSNDSISFRTWINACDEKLHILIMNNIQKRSSDFYLLKDSTSNYNYSILNIKYTNCFNFSNPNDTILQEFIFAKKYGVIMFQTYQNELFELLPLNQEQ